MNKKRKPGYAKFDYKDPKKRKYRYLLRRIWDENLPQVTFVMLNPSTAGAGEEENDPTINKCIQLAKSWDYGSLEVVNLFAYITPKPNELKKALNKGDDLVGHRNNLYIQSAAQRAESIIVAWGGWLGNVSATKYPRIKNRPEEVLNLISCKTLYCLVDGISSDLTTNGHPRHPSPRNKKKPIIGRKPYYL
ncbi:MAG: DUF1643 domain-containing protein [Nostocales cyanobacterium]|nr:MAG: DUF1643 domain-containing protein [Nostocales cyanobacterium]